jgi:hypothetical protein
MVWNPQNGRSNDPNQAGPQKPLDLVIPIQGSVALRAPVLRTPLSRSGFAVAGMLDGGVE